MSRKQPRVPKPTGETLESLVQASARQPRSRQPRPLPSSTKGDIELQLSRAHRLGHSLLTNSTGATAPSMQRPRAKASGSVRVVPQAILQRDGDGIENQAKHRVDRGKKSGLLTAGGGLLATAAVNFWNPLGWGMLATAAVGSAALGLVTAFARGRADSFIVRDNTGEWAANVTSELIDAYREDIASRQTYLQEGEGNFLADRWNVNAVVYSEIGGGLIQPMNLDYGDPGNTHQGNLLFVGGNHYIVITPSNAQHGHYFHGQNWFARGLETVANGNCLIDGLWIIRHGAQANQENFAEARRSIQEGYSTRENVRVILEGLITQMIQEGTMPQGVGARVYAQFRSDEQLMEVFRGVQTSKKRSGKKQSKKPTSKPTKGSQPSQNKPPKRGSQDKPPAERDPSSGRDSLPGSSSDMSSEDEPRIVEENMLSKQENILWLMAVRRQLAAVGFNKRRMKLLRRVTALLDNGFASEKDIRGIQYGFDNVDKKAKVKSAEDGESATKISYQSETLAEYIDGDSFLEGTIENILSSGYGGSVGTPQRVPVGGHRVNHQHVEGRTALAFCWLDRKTLHIAGFGTKSDSAPKGSGGYKWDTKPK